VLSHTVPRKLLEQLLIRIQQEIVTGIAEEGCVTSLRLAMLRSIVGYFALCFVFIAPFVGRDKKCESFG
jgi:hypothetical protein